MSRDSTTSVTHLTTEKLTAGLDEVRRSPKEDGVLEMIVSRPGVNEREVLEEAELNAEVGLVGDSWSARGTATWTPHPSMQIAIMNSRAAELVAQDKDRWPLAGDQLYIDWYLGPENLPPGTQFTLGSATLEVTNQPHVGCVKFVERFGQDAMDLVGSKVGRELNLRGIYTRVVQPGVVRVGDIANRV